MGSLTIANASFQINENLFKYNSIQTKFPIIQLIGDSKGYVQGNFFDMVYAPIRGVIFLDLNRLFKYACNQTSEKIDGKNITLLKCIRASEKVAYSINLTTVEHFSLEKMNETNSYSLGFSSFSLKKLFIFFKSQLGKCFSK